MANKYENLSQWEALPEICAARLPSTGECIMIKRGDMGHYPGHGRDPDEINKNLGVEPEQVEAMMAGSMFGWHLPGAHPKAYVGRV